MRIYLDTSVYNRPFDDQAQPRIWLETLALSVILQLVESGEVELVASSVVAYENSRNPFAERQEWVERVMALAADYRPVTPAIRDRAASLQETGIKSLDALHVATAEAAGAAWFITVDNRLIRNYRRRPDQGLAIIDPATFIREVVGQDLE